MKAIISDVHANLEALEAVLADIAELGIEEIYCLGDVVGYGPNPREVIDLVMEHCQLVLLGNHDEAVRIGPVGFTANAARAVWWTRKELQDTKQPAREGEARWKFLAGLPQTHEENDMLFVHASPRDPVREYIFPEDVYNSAKMYDIFNRFKRACFVGHTHVPGVFIEGGTFKSPVEFNDEYKIGKKKILVNVGSVGQPRDGDWRSCYVILEEKSIHFRRVEYDIDATMAKVKGNADLGNFVDRNG